MSTVTERVAAIENRIAAFHEGTEYVDDSQQALEDMNLPTLVRLTKQFAQQSGDTPNDDTLRAKSWATLNELIFRTIGTYPKLTDQIHALTAELEMSNQQMFFAQRTPYTGQGRTNDLSIMLAMLKCLAHPSKTLTVVDQSMHDLEEVPRPIYQRMINTALPCLNALETAPEAIAERFQWQTSLEVSQLVQRARIEEGMEDSDTDNEGDDDLPWAGPGIP